MKIKLYSHSIFGLCLYFFVLAYFVSCGDKTKEDKQTAPETVAVALPDVETVTLTKNYPGSLDATREVDIMCRVNGVVTGIHALPGEHVKKGQLIYTIEDTKYKDAVNQAKSALETARSNFDYYKKQYAAMEKAFTYNAVSEMELQEARNNMESAQAQIQSARAALSSAELMLDYCRITAPFDGTLSLQTFDKGALINGETNPVKLNTIYNDDIVYAYISIDEDHYHEIMKNIRTGSLSLDSVKVSFSSPLSREYFARIDYSAPEVNATTGTITLRFDIANPDGELKSGMYVNVQLPYKVAVDALVIRDASIGTDQQGKYVYLVNDSGRVVFTPVEVGQLYRDSLRIITKGLNPDSRYVTDALLKVKDGMKVRPKLTR